MIMADLTAAEKARVIALSRKRIPQVRRTALYLYDAANDRFLPATCDEQGFIKIDPTELDERYLKLSGGTMAGDIEMEGNDVTFTGTGGVYFGSGGFIRRMSTGNLGARLIDDSDYANFQMATALMQAMIALSTPFNLRSIANAASSLVIQSHTGAAFVDTLESKAGVCTIPRAGDITMLAAKSLDCVTNAAYFKPARESNVAQPAGVANELFIWHDSGNSKVYLMYNDTTEGVKKVELT